MAEHDPVELLAKVLEYEHVLQHVADPHPAPGAPPHDACPECQRMAKAAIDGVYRHFYREAAQEAVQLTGSMTSNEDEYEYCYHSRTEPGCLPCWKGQYRRQSAHLERLRQLLVDVGAAQVLEEHDAHWFGGNAQPLPMPSETVVREGAYAGACRYCGEPVAGGPGGFWSLITLLEVCDKSPTTFHER